MGQSLFNFEGKTVPLAVKSSLHLAYEKDLMIRVWYGDRQKPDWLEENDVFGYVGRSTGKVKVPLLLPVDINGRKEDSGGAILCDSITRMAIGEGKHFVETYRASFYQEPKFALKDIGCDSDLFKCAVYVSGENVANFGAKESAQEWVAFMKGKLFALYYARAN
jgi:hypothetical protein